jgi:hypothetical protein
VLGQADRHERPSELLEASAFIDLAEVHDGETEALHQRGNLRVCTALVARKEDDGPTKRFARA